MNSLRLSDTFSVYPSTPLGPPRVVTQTGTVCNDVLPLGVRIDLLKL